MYRIFILLFCLFLPQLCISTEIKGNTQFNYSPQMYTSKDSAFLVKKGNDFLKLYENTESTDLKSKYLKEANRYFYICTKSDFSNIECHIGLGKTYDEMGVDKYAKMEFNSAYNIDNKNPKLNYRYGDFYYKRKQLSMAQHYFERAYKYGYSKNLDLNAKMAKAYTKLAEPQKAEQHLKIANEIKNIQKQQQAKTAMSNTIKQASGLAVVPMVKKEPPKIPKPAPIKFNSNKNVPKSHEKHVVKYLRFDESVRNAVRIKMIDDVDKFKPMYYLFIK